MLFMGCGERPVEVASSQIVVASSPSTATDAVSPRTNTGKPLLMHYMPWYETPSVRKKWGSHWRGHGGEHDPSKKNADGLPDIWSHYHPLIGLYDSTDPDVLECHLLQMKLAGVDGVIVDWYGIARYADYPPIHEATRAMLAATAKFGMKFAACYEDRSVDLLVQRNKLKQEDVPDHLTEMFEWVETEWFTQSNYFRLDDRPLLLNFGPMFVKDTNVWMKAMSALPEKPALFGLHHLWKHTGGDGGFTWVHQAPWDGPQDPEIIRKRIGEAFTYFSKDHARHLSSAYPGYHDMYEKSHGKLDHADGETLRMTLEVALEGPWPLVQLVTWNDYGEGTMIEPTHEFGYRFLEVVQEVRKKETGASFVFTSEDLRLPAQLLKLRQKGVVERPQLDAISELLRDGNCEKARERLAELDK